MTKKSENIISPLSNTLVPIKMEEQNQSFETNNQLHSNPTHLHGEISKEE